MRFPSAEWTLELCRAINGSAAYASTAKNWEGDVTLIVEGVAGIYLDLWHGECRDARYLDLGEPHNSEFTISASLDQWTRVLRGELDPIQGLVKRQLKLDGNLVKILKNVKAAQELVKCASSIGAEP